MNIIKHACNCIKKRDLTQIESKEKIVSTKVKYEKKNWGLVSEPNQHQ